MKQGVARYFDYVCVENQYDISNCRVTLTGCGAAEVHVFPWSDPAGKGRDIGSYATQSGFRSVAAICDCLSPFISSALEGKLAPAIANWGLINLDDCCGPRDRKALLAVPSQGLNCTRGPALESRSIFGRGGRYAESTGRVSNSKQMWIHLSGNGRDGRSVTRTSVQLGGIDESIHIGAPGNNRQLFRDSSKHEEENRGKIG